MGLNQDPSDCRVLVESRFKGKPSPGYFTHAQEPDTTLKMLSRQKGRHNFGEAAELLHTSA